MASAFLMRSNVSSVFTSVLSRMVVRYCSCAFRMSSDSELALELTGENARSSRLTFVL